MTPTPWACSAVPSPPCRPCTPSRTPAWWARASTRTRKSGTSRSTGCWGQSPPLLPTPTGIESADSTTNPARTSATYKISSTCWTDSTRPTTGLTPNWSRPSKFYLSSMLSTNLTAPLLLSGISLPQELTSTLRSQEPLEHFMDLSMEEPTRLS